MLVKELELHHSSFVYDFMHIYFMLFKNVDGLFLYLVLFDLSGNCQYVKGFVWMYIATAMKLVTMAKLLVSYLPCYVVK